jgi:hypothetical protein
MDQHTTNGNGSSNGSTQRPASFLQNVSVPVRDDRDPAGRIRFMPPNFGEFPVSHISTFQGYYGSAAKVYRDYDEAIKASLDNARYMRNDCGVMECIEARQRAVCLLNWHIEPEDEKSQEQKELCEALTKILQRIRRFTEYRYNLMHAIWYGKYAIQHRFGWQDVGGKMRLLPTPRHRDDTGWLPINGDKLVFRHDATNIPNDGYFGQMGIRVGQHYSAGDTLMDRHRIEATERGMAYFLSPWQRNLLAVHKHTIEDAAYEDGIDAGTIHGVGIRSRIYWEWVQKQESLAFLMEYLGEGGSGGGGQEADRQRPEPDAGSDSNGGRRPSVRRAGDRAGHGGDRHAALDPDGLFRSPDQAVHLGPGAVVRGRGNRAGFRRRRAAPRHADADHPVRRAEP